MTLKATVVGSIELQSKLKKVSERSVELVKHAVFKGVADLEKNRGSIALLGIYEITKECEKSLDLYEEYPIVYNKVKIKGEVVILVGKNNLNVYF